MPRISLLAPSLNLEEGASGHQRGDVHGDLLNTPSITPGAGADAHESSGLPQPPPSAGGGSRSPRGGLREAHSVLEARLVSSCLSLPSSASPRFSRLLARKGVRV